jgi:hypothetical protein
VVKVIEGHSLRAHVISATMNTAVDSTDVTGRRETNLSSLCILLGREVSWWLRHYATKRQVAGSIPDGVIGIFQKA